MNTTAEVIGTIFTWLVIFALFAAIPLMRYRKNRHVKSICPYCNGSIEFPTRGVGQTVECPQCQSQIVLREIPSKEKFQRSCGQYFYWLKANHIIALICVLLLCGTALFIYEDSKAKPNTLKADKFGGVLIATPQQNRVFDVIEPKRKIISEAEAFGPVPRRESRIISEAEAFGIFDNLPDRKAGLPLGKWASTLEPVATENNLFRDPATGKLYRNQIGTIVEETNPYAGLPLEVLKQISQSRLDYYRQKAESDRQIEAVANTRILTYSVPSVSAPQIYVPPPIVAPVVTSYNPDSLANPYGAGNPYKADGLMNPYSQYGSPYSAKSWRNPYATDTPRLYDSQGNYRGKLSSNPYDPDSTANPFGRYGNPFSPDSINNPYGAGNPFNMTPIYVVPSP
jgi:hypothetical protein